MPDIRPMRDTLLRRLVTEMERDQNIFFVVADFGSPVLDEIREKYPDRFINVGIAEQNLINVSTGLALEGFTVFAYAIAPFITMRCYEQIRVNLSILSQIRPMNVNLVGVGAGYSYVVSGPTHQCLEDLSIMRALPNMEFFSPSDWKQVDWFVNHALTVKSPKYIRLDAQPLDTIYTKVTGINIEDGFHVLKPPGDVCILSTGYMTRTAHKLIQDDAGFENVGLIDIFMLDKVNEEFLIKTLSNCKRLITFEEGFVGAGGLDSFVLSTLNRNNVKIPIVNLGLSKNYNFEMGGRDHLHELAGAGKNALQRAIEEAMRD